MADVDQRQAKSEVASLKGCTRGGDNSPRFSLKRGTHYLYISTPLVFNGPRSELRHAEKETYEVGVGWVW